MYTRRRVQGNRPELKSAPSQGGELKQEGNLRKTYWTPRRVARMAIFVALSAVGALIKIPSPTGAGKTTFTMTLNGLVPQFFEGDMSGRVSVMGMDTQKFRIQTLVSRVGLVMQDPETQISGITVREDVAFGPGNMGLPPSEIEGRIAESLRVVRLAGYEGRFTSKLSGGEKQRLAIAGVLAMRPDVLVLDEPTSELDPLACLSWQESPQPRACQDLYELVGTTVATSETVPAALALFALAGGDPMKTAVLAANTGGDCDTVGAIAGSVAGAFAGIAAFPSEVIETIERVNRLDLRAIAAALVETVKR